MLCCLPKLSELTIHRCGKITGLSVVEQLKEEETDETLLLLPPSWGVSAVDGLQPTAISTATPSKARVRWGLGSSR